MTAHSISRRTFLGVAVGALVSQLPAAAWADGSDDGFPLPPFDYSKLAPQFRPSVVAYKGRQFPGTVIVDTSARQISLVVDGGLAIR